MTTTATDRQASRTVAAVYDAIDHANRLLGEIGYGSRIVRALDMRLNDPAVEPPAREPTAQAIYNTGMHCGECGSTYVRPNGTCMICDSCGSTTGCG